MTTSSNFVKLFTLIIIASAFQISGKAQTESIGEGMSPGLMTDGYMINGKGDTVSGKLRWTLKYIENNPVEIKFTGVNGMSGNFTAGEIQGFGFVRNEWMDNDPVPVKTGFEEYVSVPSFKKNVPVFMHRLLSGRITVYQNRSAVGTNTSVVKTKSRIDGIGFSWVSGEGLSIGPTYKTSSSIIESRTKYSSYYVSINGAPYIKVEKDNYDGLFIDLFSGCKVINDEIAKNPDLRMFKNFMILAEIYNQECK
jgi:hypothetical protein